jgi:hypothetical protein
MSDDLWRVINTLRHDVHQLRGQLDLALNRLGDLEADTPRARQLQLEADMAIADENELRSSHGAGCQCSYCYEPSPADYDDYDPGPECDDQGGMPGDQHPLPDDSELWRP